MSGLSLLLAEFCEGRGVPGLQSGVFQTWNTSKKLESNFNLIQIKI